MGRTAWTSSGCRATGQTTAITMTENKTLEGYRQEAIKEFTRLKVEGGRLGKAGENKELRTVELILETFRGTDVRLGLIDMDDEISSIYPIDVFDKAVAQAKAEGRREREDEMRETCQKACDESVMLRDKLNNQARSQELLRKEGRAEAILEKDERIATLEQELERKDNQHIIACKTCCLVKNAETQYRNLKKELDRLKLQGEVKSKEKKE